MSQGLDSFPADQDQFGNWQVEQEPPRQGGGCLKGCLIVAMVLAVLAIISGWFMSQNWRGWAATFVRSTLEQTLDESGLPEDEKQQIQEQVDRVVAAFEEGQLTEEQVNTLLDELAESPLAASVVAYTIEKKYFDSSGLTDEEKEAGKTTLRRCVRGWMDDDLTDEDIDAVLTHIGTKDEDGNWELHDEVTDDELKAFLAGAKERADNAGVAETVEEVDPSDEIERIVNAALNPQEAEQESEDPPDAAPPEQTDGTAQAPMPAEKNDPSTVPPVSPDNAEDPTPEPPTDPANTPEAQED